MRIRGEKITRRINMRTKTGREEHYNKKQEEKNATTKTGREEHEK